MASLMVMSYAEMLLAIVPAAPPTRKNQRATSCPAPISANMPYLVLSRLIWTAFWCVSSRVVGAGAGQGAEIRAATVGDDPDPDEGICSVGRGPGPERPAAGPQGLVG